MEQSIWKGSGTQYPSFQGDISADAAVIGGGIAGLLSALELAKRGQSVIILEAGEVGGGESGRSSAMLSFAHDLIYYRLIAKHGIDTAQEYYRLNSDGMRNLAALIEEEGIECGYTSCNMYLYATTEKGQKQLQKEMSAYDKLDIAYEQAFITELPLSSAPCIKLSGQAYFDPLRLCKGLSKVLTKRGVKIYENTHVTAQPKDGRLVVDGHTVSAKNFIIATHYPYLSFPGLYFAKMHQHRSYNVVFDAGFSIKNMYESAEDDGFEFRPMPQGIMCGGAAVRTGKYKYQSRYEIVEQKIVAEFPKARFISKCSAQDCMTLDLMPYAGKFSHFIDNVYMISGFNKWGFSTAMASAKIIADKIEGSIDQSIFDTSRAEAFTAPIATAAHIIEMAGSFAEYVINSDAKKFERIQVGQGAIVKHDGKRLGVYRSEKGLKIVSAVCTHLGCALKWNKDEKSWDCPCHGSRYDVDGKILDNPAIKELDKR